MRAVPCGVMDEQQEPQATAEEAPAASSRKSGAVWIWLGVAAVLVICGFAVFGRSGSGGDSDEYGAKVACRDFVKARLKAPATADFSGETVTGSGTSYTVRGAVDSENSFGAKLRSTYVCVVEDAGSEWRLTSLSGL